MLRIIDERLILLFISVSDVIEIKSNNFEIQIKCKTEIFFKMFQIFWILISICFWVTTAQWMPFLDSQHINHFPHQLTEQMVVPKDSTTKIPIILLLKPKKAKSLSAGTTTELMERHPTDDDQTFTYNKWFGVPESTSASMVSPQIHVNRQMSASEVEESFEPNTEASDSEEVKIRSRGGEQIKWSALNTKRTGVTAEQLASISHLFPKLTAMSPPNADLTDLSNKNTGAFEDALKKFTNNLTDMEHRGSQYNQKNTSDEEEVENSTDSVRILLIILFTQINQFLSPNRLITRAQVWLKL